MSNCEPNITFFTPGMTSTATVYPGVFTKSDLTEEDMEKARQMFSDYYYGAPTVLPEPAPKPEEWHDKLVMLLEERDGWLTLFDEGFRYAIAPTVEETERLLGVEHVEQWYSDDCLCESDPYEDQGKPTEEVIGSYEDGLIAAANEVLEMALYAGVQDASLRDAIAKLAKWLPV